MTKIVVFLVLAAAVVGGFFYYQNHSAKAATSQPVNRTGRRGRAGSRYSTSGRRIGR